MLMDEVPLSVVLFILKPIISTIYIGANPDFQSENRPPKGLIESKDEFNIQGTLTIVMTP